MGLRILQWVYNLGVQHERHRIAAYLQSVQTQHWDDNDYLRRELRGWDDGDNSEKAAKKKRRIELKLAVDDEIINIIKYMFADEPKYQRGASVMFPEKED